MHHFALLAQGTGDTGFSIGWTDISAVLPVVVLILTGSAVLVMDLFRRGWADTAGPGEKWPVHFVALLGSVIAGGLAAVSIQTGVEGTYFAGALQVDLFGNVVTLIILVATFLSLVVAVDYLRRFGIEHGEFHCLVLYGAASMVLFVQSNSIILLFLSLETLSMAAYVLTGLTRNEKRSVEGAMKYFVLGGFSSGFLLFGLTLLYAATGETEISAMAAAASSAESTPDIPLLLTGLALSLVGLVFKVGAFPFHAWVPDAYEGAPAVVTGFMATTVKAAAFAVLLRFAYAFGMGVGMEPGALHDVAVRVLSVVAVATMVFGNLVALVQSSVKRMLAYSAIAHSGYLLVGVVAAISDGANGASGGASVLFYLLPYSFMTVAAFALLGLAGEHGADRESFADYRGLSRVRPGIALALLVVLVSFAGIPPTAGFWAKLYVFRDAVLTGHWVLALVGVLTSVVSVYFYLRLVVNVYMEEAQETPLWRDVDGRTALTFVLVASAIALVVLGIFPDAGYGILLDSVTALTPAS